MFPVLIKNTQIISRDLSLYTMYGKSNFVPKIFSLCDRKSKLMNLYTRVVLLGAMDQIY